MKQPIQPLYTDDRGVLRFQPNAIVRYLLDFGGIDMNRLAVLPFNQEDQEQFAMLIGYSLSGFGDLSYASTATYETAERMAEDQQDEQTARLAYLENELQTLKFKLREPMAQLFGVHPDDLKD